MDWFRKISDYSGRSDLSSEFYEDPVYPKNDASKIYQAPAPFDNVFLGGYYPNADFEEEIREITGQDVCVTMDVRKLPEPEQWSQDYHDLIFKHLFEPSVKELIGHIRSVSCPIYIFCSAGANRPVSILTAALANLTGKSVDDILGEMKRERGMIGPHDAYYLMAAQSSPADQHRIPELKKALNITKPEEDEISTVDALDPQNEFEDQLIAQRDNWIQRLSSLKLKNRNTSLSGVRLSQLVRILRHWGYDLNRVTGSHHIFTKPGKDNVLISPGKSGEIDYKGVRDTFRDIAEAHGVSLLDFLQGKKPPLSPEPELEQNLVIPHWKKQPWYQQQDQSREAKPFNEAKPMIEPFKRTLNYLGDNYRKSRDKVRNMFVPTPEKMQAELENLRTQLSESRNHEEKAWFQNQIRDLERELQEKLGSTWEYHYKNSWRK